MESGLGHTVTQHEIRRRRGGWVRLSQECSPGKQLSGEETLLGAGTVSRCDGRGMGAECGRSGSSSSLQPLGGEMGHPTSPRRGLPQTARLLWASGSALLSRGVCRVLPGPSAGSQEKRGQCLQNKAAFRGQRLGMGFGGLSCEGCAWHPAQGLAYKRCWDCFVIHGSASSPPPTVP